eukprot:CAMPEP_0181107984 /NCGR_PEP_ID=MMETSP1071-20121207/17380_1 /TAXON_ID=35127 /ORGANISM="Thalassiosira sp., Strain NH16" /LENGTH=59 /DNA_ID=CAMNT_0023191541 /DNA_START=18 /DNA_END=193 /DNA_ORIENTATION=+
MEGILDNEGKEDGSGVGIIEGAPVGLTLTVGLSLGAELTEGPPVGSAEGIFDGVEEGPA